MQSSKMIDSIVSLLAKSKDSHDEDMKKWMERVETYKQKLDAAKLKTIAAGQRIDVRDTEYIWCTGIVELKITHINKPPLLYIHYEVNSRSLFSCILLCVGMEQKIR
jgi:hypothetical protein